MAMKLQVGLAKKLGLPDFGSLGASCQVEIEVDAALLQGHGDGFQRQVHNAFAACQQAVEEQLARQTPTAPTRQSTPPNGNGRSAPSRGRPATASQARALRALADRQHIDLSQLLGQRFGVDRPEDLSIGDASAMIDSLKNSASRNGVNHAARH